MVDVKAISIITALVIVEALQVLGLVAHIYSFIPIHVDGPILPGLELERESFLYMIFLGVIVFFTVILTLFIYKPLKTAGFKQKCLRFLYVETGWTILMFFVFFKWVTYRYPFYNILPLENGQWVLPFFYGVVFLGFCTKVFWVECDVFIQKCFDAWARFVFPTKYLPAAYMLIISVIGLLLYPNAGLSAGIIASWSNFAVWQNFWFTWFLGARGFSPEQIVLILFYTNTVILSLVLIGAHRYLKSLWLAAFVVLTAMQMTFFHYGMSPVCWNYPQHTLLNISVNLGFLNEPNHLPMFAALRVRQFFSFFIGYGIAVFYVCSMLLTWGKDKVATGLSIIGMLLYTRYIAQPEVAAYGAVCLPAIVLCAFWLKRSGEHFYPKGARYVYAGLTLLTFLMLLTNRVFVTYPHFWVTHVQ